MPAPLSSRPHVSATRGVHRWQVGENFRPAEALLETARKIIEEARGWASSLRDEGSALEVPVVLTGPESAPSWLTAYGPRRTARHVRSPRDVESAAVTHALRLSALDRLLADLEKESGPITPEELATAVQRL